MHVCLREKDKKKQNKNLPSEKIGASAMATMVEKIMCGQPLGITKNY